MLHVPTALNETIVSMVDSPTRYVDNLWFQNKMNEKIR